MRRAFTLVELLVVISIVAMLIVILLPSLASARDSAVSLQCLANNRQLASAWYCYSADHKGEAVGGYARRASEDEQGASWAVMLSDYYGNTDDALRCPSALKPKITGGLGVPGYPDQIGTAKTSWTLPRPQLIRYADEARLYEGGYTMNGWTDAAIDRRPFPEFVISNTDDPDVSSDMLLFADGAMRSAWPLDSHPQLFPAEAFTIGELNIDLKRFGLDRHNEHINAAMMDGSGRVIRIVDLKSEVKFYGAWGE